MKDADAVGSMHVVSRYNLRISPATVRNEMVALADKGYLTKSHSSSGRIPTDMGLRYFIQEIMHEEELPNTDTVKVRIRVHKNRFDEERLMSQVMTFLSEETGYAAVSLIEEILRFRGISLLMDYEELKDVTIMEVLLRALESRAILSKIFCRGSGHQTCVVIGSETEIEGMQNFSLVFTAFNYFGGKKGYLGVIGPRRMQYSRAIPAVKTVGALVEHAVRGLSLIHI